MTSPSSRGSETDDECGVLKKKTQQFWRPKIDDDFGGEKRQRFWATKTDDEFGQKIRRDFGGKKMTNSMCVLQIGLSCEQKSMGTRERERVTERGREGGG